MCPCSLQRWQSPLRLSSFFGLVDRRRARIVYILLTFTGTGGGIDGRVEVYIFISEGGCCVVSIW